MKKLTKVILSGAAVTALGCGMAFGLAGCGSTETVTINGSSSVTPLMEVLAARYEASHDNVRIEINMTSSGTGITAAINGTADIGMSSRWLENSELEQGVSQQQLCKDGIALVVGTECTATNITSAEVTALYQNLTPACNGAITNAVGRDQGSGTRDYFDESFKLEESGYHKDVGTGAETGNVIELLNGTSNTLGYISYGSLAANEGTIKALSVDGVACTLENIESGAYSLCRPFVIVLNNDAELSDAAQDFIDYIMSAEAQSVITGEGYISTYEG